MNSQDDSIPSDEELEGGIDAIDRLRGTMRRAGLLECADALDQVFVKCLRAYMERKDAGESPAGSGSETLN